METQRLNPYLLPHKGLRNLLAKVSFLAGNLDYTSVHEVEQLKLFARELFYLLEQHAQVEESVVLPELEQKAPGSTQENHEEHEFLEAIITKLDKQTEQLSVESTPTEFFGFLFRYIRLPFKVPCPHAYGGEGGFESHLGQFYR